MSESVTKFYKMDIQGIVYLVDPATSVAHLYDLESTEPPIPIGTLDWTSINSAPKIQLYSDWTDRIAAKIERNAAKATSTV